MRTAGSNLLVWRVTVMCCIVDVFHYFVHILYIF